jgi:hypothetical protein
MYYRGNKTESFRDNNTGKKIETERYYTGNRRIHTRIIQLTRQSHTGIIQVKDTGSKTETYRKSTGNNTETDRENTGKKTQVTSKGHTGIIQERHW